MKIKIIACMSLLALLTGCTNPPLLTNDEIEALMNSNSELEFSNKTLQDENDYLKSEIVTLRNKLDEPPAVIDYKYNDPLLKVLTGSPNEFRYVFEDASETIMSSISIVGDSSVLNETFDTIRINDPNNETGEKVRIQVFGEVIDFILVGVKYDEEAQAIVETEEYYSVSSINNKNIIFSTIIPEGVPSAKLKWKNKNFETFEHYIAFDGYGFDGQVYLSNQSIVEE